MTTYWLTGLPCSGKTTLARALVARLRQGGRPAVLIDGDEVREALSSDLGFDSASRAENARRVAAMAELVSRSEVTAVVALVSPSRQAREEARALHEGRGRRFVEVWLSASLEVCASRDDRGLYARARSGEALNVTGVDASYETPARPQFEVGPGETAEHAAARILGASS